MKKVVVFGVAAVAYLVWSGSPALGACGSSPESGCKTALKSIALIKNDTSDPTKDKLIFKWIKGAATTQAEFGVPTGTTNYSLCVYAGTTETLVAEANVPGGANWSAISTKGYKYKEGTGTADGIQKVILKGGDPGKAKALAKGKGANLPDPSHPLEEPVLVQLVNDDPSGACFEGEFDGADVIKNDASQFKAKAQ